MQNKNNRNVREQAPLERSVSRNRGDSSSNVIDVDESESNKRRASVALPDKHAAQEHRGSVRRKRGRPRKSRPPLPKQESVERQEKRRGVELLECDQTTDDQNVVGVSVNTEKEP